MKQKPSKAQIRILAWIIHRYSGKGYALDCNDVLDIKDKTVVALESAGWIDRVKFYDDVAKWRWSWFYVTAAGRALPAVVAEIARMKSRDDAAAAEANAADDEAAAYWATRA
jgi:hypothetical protein